MSAPTITGYEPLDRLNAQGDRLGLLVELSYSPSAQRHWVIAHDPLTRRTTVVVERDTYVDAITEATRQMEAIR